MQYIILLVAHFSLFQCFHASFRGLFICGVELSRTLFVLFFDLNMVYGFFMKRDLLNECDAFSCLLTIWFRNRCSFEWDVEKNYLHLRLQKQSRNISFSVAYCIQIIVKCKKRLCQRFVFLDGSSFIPFQLMNLRYRKKTKKFTFFLEVSQSNRFAWFHLRLENRKCIFLLI